MVDEHGEIEIRDWSGATYNDADYVDKSIRIRRVRVYSVMNSPMKVAETSCQELANIWKIQYLIWKKKVMQQHY